MPIKKRKTPVQRAKDAQVRHENDMMEAVQTPIIDSILREFGITGDDILETHEEMTRGRDSNAD